MAAIDSPTPAENPEPEALGLPLQGCTAAERLHQDAWYADAIQSRFFEHEGFRRLVEWNLASLRRAVPLHSSMTVLSIGCGLGEYECLLAPHVGTIIGLDLSSVAIQQARTRAAGAGITNIEFTHTTVAEAAFPDESFHLVYGFGVLHHLASGEQHATLRKAHRWLKPGGWLYTRDPNARGVLRCLARSIRRNSRFHSPGERDLDPYRLRAEAEAAGFSNIRIDFTDVLGGPLPWLVRSSSAVLWQTVFGFDRAWLSVPPLRTFASQFAMVARR